MPQELHVVRCYNCEKFQVDIVKKQPKWVCKICGEKQSLKQVFAKGTGKECRQYVQEINVNHGNIKENLSDADLDENIGPEVDNVMINENFENCLGTNSGSKWEKYLEKPQVSVQEVQVETNEITQYSFERPLKKSRKNCRKHTTHDDTILDNFQRDNCTPYNKNDTSHVLPENNFESSKITRKLETTEPKEIYKTKLCDTSISLMRNSSSKWSKFSTGTTTDVESAVKCDQNSTKLNAEAETIPEVHETLRNNMFQDGTDLDNILDF